MDHRRGSARLARLRPAIAIAALAAGLGGCAEIHHGVGAVGRIGSTPAEAEAKPVKPVPPGVKTVRPRGVPRGQDVADEEAPAVVEVAAVPSPRQIFDFRPAGGKPDGWRQPFVIDTSDGPLAADVRRSAAELKTFLAGLPKPGAKAAAAKPCSESDVAVAKPGCRRTVVSGPPAGGTAVR